MVPSFVAWRCKAVPMTVSVANGAKALVILFVEDEFFVRDDIANCLRDAGYVVVEGASGEEAIALCCKSAAMIDMVLTDINLGGSTSGWDVAECFRMERPIFRFSTCQAIGSITDAVSPEACSSPSRFNTVTC